MPRRRSHRLRVTPPLTDSDYDTQDGLWKGGSTTKGRGSPIPSAHRAATNG